MVTKLSTEIRLKIGKLLFRNIFKTFDGKINIHYREQVNTKHVLQMIRIIMKQNTFKVFLFSCADSLFLKTISAPKSLMFGLNCLVLYFRPILVTILCYYSNSKS